MISFCLMCVQSWVRPVPVAGQSFRGHDTFNTALLCLCVSVALRVPDSTLAFSTS